MDACTTKKALKTTRGLTYTYYVSPAKPSKPTLLLSHGWPDCAHLWSDLIASHLVPNGYGVVAPDCLGYDGTDKPTDPTAYAINLMAGDLIEVLDEEDVQKVVSLGHDWGSMLAQRVYLYHPERVEGVVLMNVAYRPPAREKLDLDTLRPAMEDMIGYFTFWYWYLFTSPEGAAVLDAHLESLWCACHGSGSSVLDTFCKKDGMRDFLVNDRTQETQGYATDELKNEFIGRFKRDGIEGPLCWYKAAVENVSFEAEKEIEKSRWKVDVPMLFVGGMEDKICLTGAIEEPKQMGLLPYLTIEELDASHWLMLAKPKELGGVVTKWLAGNYGGAA